MAKEDASGSLMSPAEMKPLLLLSKRDPVSAVIGLTKAKDGVVFLAKKVRPRKLMAQMKKRAADARLDLEMTSLRFGRAAVDTAVDSALVTFTVNKEAAGALRPKLLVQLKKAGFAKCEIVVDPSLETEPDEDELHADGVTPGGGTAPAAAAGAGAAVAANAPAAADGGRPAAASPSGGEASAGQASARDAAGAAAGGPAGAAGTAGQPAAEPDRAALARRITDLVKRMMGVIPANPPGADAMRTAALAAQAGLKAGDLAAAGRSADTLERLLASGPPATAPGGPAGAARPANSAVFDKARMAWVATRQKVQSEFDKLFAEISSVYRGHGVIADLETTFHARFSPVMEQLDQSLSGKLQEIGANPDPGAHARLVQEAQQVIAQYETYIAGEVLFSQLDRNPFTPLAVQKTLTVSLAALAKAVH